MTVKPIRIQRKRTKGFNLQAESMERNGLPCVYVGRPTRYGNPHKVGDVVTILDVSNTLTLENCLDLYRVGITANKAAFFETLRGKNLACFCSENRPCHADILLELANQ